MYKEPLEYLKHIRDECQYILNETRGNFSMELLNKDETLKRAVVRSLEIIGEASKKIPDDFKSDWNSIEWKSMAGMRDRLIHDYMGVNYYIVFDVVKNKIPNFYDQINKAIKIEEDRL